MTGYDIELVDLIFNITKIPITIVGGAQDYDDLRKIINKYGPIGIGAGSIFVYKGKRKAVLVNYPDKNDKLELFNYLIK